MQLFLNTTALAVGDSNIISLDKSTIHQLLFTLANTLILIVVLTLIMYKPVKKFMDDRKNAIERDINSAKALEKDAKELKVEYETKLAELEHEKQQILENAHKKALERSDYIIKEAKKEAEHIHSSAMTELKESRQSIEEEIKRQLIELSVMVAGKFIEDNIDEQSQNRYIEQALESWEEGLWLD